MSSISTYPYENCPKKCKNPVHGDRINSALVNGTVSDDKIAAFIAKTCRSFAYVLDNQGQTALHVATTAHKYYIVEWLINNGADVNFSDKQSGQTALHRAINYGYFDIALLLLSYGASFEINDSKLKSPVQYCCKPKNYVHEQSQIKEQNQLKEIFVWGTNHNYNLGLENKEGKSYPFYLDYFSKKNLTINNVSLSCYHCLYVDDKGDLYAVGLGDGGRLGTNNESTLVLPKQIYLTNKHKNERTVAISTARNHSIVLTSEDRIFTCGLNTNGQLGQRTSYKKSLILRDIDIGERGFKNVIARDYHCLAYTSDSIYVWGTNYGQFGFPATETKVVQPKKMDTFLNQISSVDSSNTAIVYLTTSGSILLSTKYKTKKIKKPIVYESIKHFAIVGGNTVNAQEKSPPDPLEIIVLSQSDALFLWSNDEQMYLRCFMPLSLSIRTIYWSAGTLLTLATDGTLLTGSIQKQKVNTSANRNFVEEFIEQKSKRHVDISETQKCVIDLKRVPNIDRITNVYVDQRCESFVILQENSKRYLTIPVLDDDPINFKALLHDTTESDLLHDIVFHVEDEVFSAHKYIVFSRAEGLRDIIQQYKDKHIYLNFEGLTSKMFELIMKYIYENHTLTLTDIEDIEASFYPYCGLSNLDICTLFREYMGKFGVSNMGKLGVSNWPKIDHIQTSADSNELLKFDRLSYPELYDVTIKCADSKEIKAHRCVLSTRLEYFNLMFNSSWSESTKDVVNLTTIPLEYMEPIINFLYHNDTNIIRNEQYTDTFLYHLMEICDQFFVTRLKNIVEIIMIEKMNARKCADMFEFAIMFNCTLLETAALDFICQNMGRLLENRCLDHLQIESLEKISTHYRRIYQFNDSDLISNYFFNDFISDEMILSFIDDFQVDLYYKNSDDTPKSKPKKTERLSSDKRNYEKEAINYVKNLSLESDASITNIITPVEDIINEAEEVSKSIESEAAKWMKVADKKDVKKKNVLTVLKTSELLKNEPKEPENFTPLKIKNTDESMDKSFRSSVDESPSIIFNLSLGDFTPQKGAKLSQKQRRRQLSQSDSSPLINENLQSPPFKSAWNAPVEKSEQSNAWENRNCSDAQEILKTRTQPINIAAKKMPSTSFNDSISLPLLSPSKSTARSPSVQSNSSFTKILADERKQKEYYNKMKSKSLLLTQIEEAAISELKKFYNVDNVFDENIEIERKSNVNSTVNFARWRHE